MRLLDLFCGAGGCSVGYERAGFTVIVGVDLKAQPRYPDRFRFVQADALEFLRSVRPGEFDAIAASPPCQRYSEITKASARTSHPDLIAPVRAELERIGSPYVIENVEGARKQLHAPLLLCGTMFGLGVLRHRLFECSFLPFAPGACAHRGSVKDGTYSGVRGGGPRSDHPIPYAVQRPRWEQDMGIDWEMTRKELAQAIPPAFTEWIGVQLLRQIGDGR